MFVVGREDLERMTATLFIDGPIRGRAASRFWVLLVLAAIIATVGVITDSTATVIGAMIVAPLMVPILGSALALVLADRHHLLRSLGHVIGGSLLVISIGIVFGAADNAADRYAANSQVIGRISPRFLDLLAALATGAVGAFALVRSDIADTLPGVAIAISLVPPLAVTGLLIAAGRPDDAVQSFLLFATNVAAIIATGTIVLLLYRVRRTAVTAGMPIESLRGRTLVPVALMLILVAVPLAYGSASIARDEQLEVVARPVVADWASASGWQEPNVSALDGTVTVSAIGGQTDVDVEDLRSRLDAAGLEAADLTVRLIVGGVLVCPAGGGGCAPET
jgi:uncharacterized hydrophobic protein (TIGR00271 family)